MTWNGASSFISGAVQRRPRAEWPECDIGEREFELFPSARTSNASGSHAAPLDTPKQNVTGKLYRKL